MERSYFAYGSNLDAEDFRAWCAERGFGDARLELRSTAVVHGRILAFTRYSPARRGGVLDIPEHAGASVRGALFRVLGSGWRALDEKEGRGSGAYRRVPVIALPDTGARVEAVTYEVVHKKRFVAPTDAYLRAVRRGLRTRGLPTHDLDRALSRLAGE